MNNYLKNLDLIILISATPISEKITNILNIASLLDNEFKISDWREKCSKFIKYKNGDWEYKITNPKCLKGILKEIIYTWDGFNPIYSLKVIEVPISIDDNLREKIDNTKNNTTKEKLLDDHRFSNIEDHIKPEKIKEAIKIIRENNDKKIVIFSKFKYSQKNISDDLNDNNIRCEYINSKIKYREKIINEFQNGNLNVINVQIDTAVGITLDKADIAIIICDEYKPENFYQALGRIVSTNLEDLKLKNVYYIYDEKYNSRNILENKTDTIYNYGVDYKLNDNYTMYIFCESSSDVNFIKKFLDNNKDAKKYSFINRNKIKFNPNFLYNFKKFNFNFILICDNDKYPKDLKLDKNEINYLTFNDLFNVDGSFENIEKILLSLNCYKKEQLDLLDGCNKEKNVNYKKLIELKNDNNCYKNIEHSFYEFAKCFYKNDGCSEIKDIWLTIKSVLESEDINYNLGNIKNIIKSYFMDNINDDFIKEYSSLVSKKIDEKRLSIIGKINTKNY